MKRNRTTNSIESDGKKYNAVNYIQSKQRLRRAFSAIRRAMQRNLFYEIYFITNP